MKDELKTELQIRLTVNHRQDLESTLYFPIPLFFVPDFCNTGGELLTPGDAG